LFASVAAVTSGVRTPRDLFEYATFYHRSTGTNFFDLTGAPHHTAGRIHRILVGTSSFFGVAPWGRAALVVLAVLLALGAIGNRMRRGSPRAIGGGGRFGERELSSLAANSPRWLWIHVAVLCALWTLHFAFYMPNRSNRGSHHWCSPSSWRRCSGRPFSRARSPSWP
jgi:hypothetical protein